MYFFWKMQITQLVFDFSQESSATAKSCQPGWLVLACLSLLFCGFLKVTCRTACQPLCWKRLEWLKKNFKLHTKYLIFSILKNLIPKCPTFSSFNLPNNCSNWGRQPCLPHTKKNPNFVYCKKICDELWMDNLIASFLSLTAFWNFYCHPRSHCI